MLIKNLDLAQIKDVLESGDFDQLIGARENEFLEAKPALAFDMREGHPTNIKLAKYAAGFANQKGGYVVCGLKTTKLENTPHEVVNELDLLAQTNFYKPEEIINRVTQSTYPSIRVETAWYPYRKDTQVGVGVIYVPRQEETQKYFHIRVREIDGKLLQKELFGVPVRADGFTNWVEVDELYRRSRLGPNKLREFYGGLSGQIKALAETVAKTKVPTEDELQNKIDQIQ
jgi:hypothetical protein